MKTLTLVVPILAVLASCHLGVDGTPDGASDALAPSMTQDPSPPSPPPPPPPPPPPVVGTDARAGDGGDACLRVPPGLVPATELHVITIDKDGRSEAAQPVEVTVRAANAPVTLFLTSYDPVSWHVHLDRGAAVARVIVGSDSGSTVDGVGPDVPIEELSHGDAGWASGFEPADDTGGRYTKLIDIVRKRGGGLETTFQGAKDVASFTVPYEPRTDLAVHHYDMRKPCVDRCTVAPDPLRWESWLPLGSEVHGLEATMSADAGNFGGHLRASRGARCGKHYVEIEVTGKTGVGLSYRGRDEVPLATLWDLPGTRLVDGRIGIALDLDDGTLQFVDATHTTAPASLHLWSHAEVVPGVDVYSAGTVTLITKPPFLFVPPPGFATDL